MYRKLTIAKRFAGLTLIEVVIAAALLAAAMVPILKCLTVAHLSAAKVEHKTQALVLAQAKLDEIKARSIYNYTNSGNPLGFAEDTNSPDGSYLCKVTDNLGNPLKTITVSVGFDLDNDHNLDDDEINITLATLIARRWTD
jgi:type II secretory pathway pseudopilin PulG